MSEYINNREHRQKTIKEIIQQLHDGKTVAEVKQQFEDAFQGVTASEISEAETALISEGLPISEVQRLCDVHAAVFKGSIEEIHQISDPARILGHPVNTLQRENREIEKIIEKEIQPYLSDLEKENSLDALSKGINHLSEITIHYLKKENLLFPYMEQYGITAPPKVMWGVDDEIRNQIKEVKTSIMEHSTGKTELELKKVHSTDKEELKLKIDAILNRVTEMIFKEENIMLPMLLENLTQEEWKIIADESGEIGYMVDKVPTWEPFKESVDTIQNESKPDEDLELIHLPTGVFRVEELISMLNTLPFDITFVNKDDIVKYFSEGKDRVFPRTKAIIGRNVSNCHPPTSVHVVEKIVEDFKNGIKDHEDFWINMGNKYILIRYYAVRNEKGDYLGVLEVTQDIKPIQAINGEKRLMTE